MLQKASLKLKKIFSQGKKNFFSVLSMSCHPGFVIPLMRRKFRASTSRFQKKNIFSDLPLTSLSKKERMWPGSIHIKNIFKPLLTRRFGAIAVLIIFLIANFFQNSVSTQSATYLFTQTDWTGGVTGNNAAHPGDATGWDEYSSGTNVTTSVAGQATLSETTHENFSETFTADTYKDAINTTADWNTSSGQVQMAGETAGTNLYEKLHGFLAGSQINAQVKAGDDYYIGATNGTFLKYSSITDTATNLTSKISSSWGAQAILALEFDSANNVIYLGGGSGRFFRYNTPSWSGSGTCTATGAPYTADTACSLVDKISSFWTTSYNVNSLVFHSADNALYLAGASGKFARYNTSSYPGGGTYPTADTAYDLASKISSFWGTTIITSGVLDSANKVLYLGGESGKFARYNTTVYAGGDASYPTADLGYDLTAKISGFSSSATIPALVFDSTGGVVYLGMWYGIFGRYNTPTYGGGDASYPTADTAYDLTSRISSAWGQGTNAMVLDSANKVIYLGGSSKFGRYNLASYSGGGTYPTADTGYNLTSKISAFWAGDATKALSFDSSNNIIYLAGGTGRFGRYNTTSYTGGGTYPTADTGYYLSSKVNGLDWNGNQINAIVGGDGNDIYIAGNSGVFARYNTQTGVATELTSKISSFWSTNSVSTLVFDSANKVIYLGGASGKFARYNTTGYAGGDASYPAADTAYDLYSKTMFVMGTVTIGSLAFDSNEKAVYLGDSSATTGRLVRYNVASYSAGGTYPTADTAYSLTAKISSFWGTSLIHSLVFDSANKVIYLGGASGKFARYNTTGYAGGDASYPAADTAYDLNSKISSFTPSNIYSLALDSTNKVVYLGVRNGKFFLYNTASYPGGGTYPTADTAYDLTSKISSFWSTSHVYSVALDGSGNAIYLGGASGKFARYSILNDSATNLRSPDMLSWWGTVQVNALAVDASGKIFVGGLSGYFAQKPPMLSTHYAYSTTLDSVGYDIYHATLTKNDTPGIGTVVYQLSNDGGATWETSTPGAEHVFTSVGSDLRFKIAVTGNATVQDVSIAYWSFNTSGSLTSSKYNTGDFSNVLAKIAWTENLLSGTDLKFQLRTSADGNTWTAWCGPDDGVIGSCNSATYFTDPTGNETVDDINNDNTNDQWFQYQATLTSSDGKYGPTLSDSTVTYVVNATPQIQNVTASQGADGLVTVNFEVRDPDTTTGATQYSVAAGLQYCTANCSNPGSETWTDAATLSGDYGSVAVQEVGWNSYQMAWSARADYPEIYNPTDFKIRVKAYDGELANHTGYGQSAAFTLDTKNPTSFSFTIDHTTNELTLTTPTDDSSFQMGVSNIPGTFTTFEPFASPYVYGSITPDPATVHVRVKDAYGNYADAQATTPARPSNIIYYDTSSAINEAYQEFIAWNVVSASQSGSGFNSYKIYRAVDSGAYSLLTTIVDRNTNYFLDKVKDSDPNTDDSYPSYDPGTPVTFHYKVVTDDTDGNVSNYSATVSDSPDGNGGSDSTPPTITDVQVSEISTTSAIVTWTTDEAANSSVGYSEDYTYLPERGLASFETIGHSIALTGLIPGTTYNIKVKSYDVYGNLGSVCYGGDGCSPGANNPSVFNFTTLEGPAISNVRLKESSNSQATITWETDEDSDSHVIYSATVSNGALVNPQTAGSDLYVNGGYPYLHEVTITGLEQSTPYYFYVQSQGASGTATLFNVTADPPFFTFLTGNDNDDPVISSVSPIIISNSEVAIYWSTDEPADSMVEYKAEGESYSDNLPVTIATFDKSHYVIVTGLLSNTQYTYRITSADINGNDAVSSDYTFTTLPDPVYQHDPISLISGISDPPAVLTDTKAVISFTTDQAAQCVIEFGTASGNYTEVPVAESGFNETHSMHIPGLIFQTTYYYQITCSDNLENTVTSDELSFTTSEKLYTEGEAEGLGDAIAPVISSVAAGSETGESVTVTWTTDEAASSYVQFGSVSGTYTDMAGDPLVNSDELNYDTAHTVIINGLTPGVQYYFTVISHDSTGNIATSSEDAFTTGSSSSISSINITSASLGEAVVTWKTSSETSSLVEYGAVETYGQKKEDSAAVTEHSVTINGLTAAQLYHLRVGGEDANSQLYYSDDYTFIPKSPPQIGIIGVKDINEHGATVSFTTDLPTDYLVTFTSLSDANDSGSKGKPEFAINHEIVLDKLKPGTIYSLKIKATDEQGNSVDKLGPNFTTGKDEKAPEIKQTRTESALAQNEKVQTIISWETNELSVCKLVYREGASGEEREYKLSDRPATNHVAVVTAFKSGTVYYFKIKSTDEAGNEAVSNEYALLTPQKKENIVQIIVNNFQDIFSWTSRVGG